MLARVAGQTFLYNHDGYIVSLSLSIEVWHISETIFLWQYVPEILLYNSLTLTLLSVGQVKSMHLTNIYQLR